MAFTICPRVLSVHFLLLLLFVCFLFISVCVYVSLCDFVSLVLPLPFALGFYLFFWFFFLPFLLNHVAGWVLVLQPGVGPEPLKRESRVQDTGPRETSGPNIISVGESSLRDLCLNTKTQSHPTASKFQCWTPHDKQLPRQEHNHTH